jgi:hypothetical protein
MPDQASGGDMFSPTQLGLRCLSAHAFLIASEPLSAIRGEVSTRTSALAVLTKRQDQPDSKHQTRETALHGLPPILAM